MHINGLRRKARPKRTFFHVVLTPVVIINCFQHRPIVHERTDFHRVHKKCTLTRSLEREIKFNVFILESTAKTVNYTRRGWKTNIRGIIHIDCAISIYITISNISRHRHSSSPLIRRIVDFSLSSEESFSNVTYSL